MDCKDTLFPIARKTPNRLFMCFPLIFGWPLFLYNVRLLYLNGIIQEEVHTNQLKGFEVHEQDTHVCRLKKVLYGLK